MRPLRRFLDALGFACDRPTLPRAFVQTQANARTGAEPPTQAPRHRPVHTIDVRQTAPRRFVAELIGTPYWSAGPTREIAVGALVLVHGARIGVGFTPDDVPFVRVARPM